jgi:intein/homing endonuclease
MIAKKLLYRLFIKENNPASLIAKKLGCTTNHVYGQLSKYDIRRYAPRKTDWYNKSFKDLTDEEIYILGFLWADGFLYKSSKNHKYCSLQCQILFTDYKILKNCFTKVGKWSLFIRKERVDKKGVKRQKNITLAINDIALVSKLISFDFNKKNYTPPNKLLKLIPKNKHYLFYRGYFDGDGCFYITNKAKQFILGSTYEQDWSSIVSLFNKIKIKKYKIQKNISKKGHKDSRIRVSSLDAVVKIANYLYQDRLDIGLKRKYNKVKNLIKVNK